MKYMPRWKIISILAVCLIGLLYSLPNVVGRERQAWLQENLPGWMPTKTVNLGLDLQGGSHLLLEVDTKSVIDGRLEALVSSFRDELRREKIPYTRIVHRQDAVRVTLRDAADQSKVRAALTGIDNGLDIGFSNDGKTVDATFSDAAVKRIRDQTVGQSIEIVRRRVDETGTREPIIQRQGADRIIVQLPGLDDPARVKELIGTTAKLSFHLVDADALSGAHPSAGTVSLPSAEEGFGSMPVFRREVLTGDMLVDAQPSFQQGMPVVSFRLNKIGARRFCDVTTKNTHKPFAIVLDGKVISAPNINEPICAGQAVISGSFSVQETSDLSLLLRAGALPAPLKVMEERTVGPSLGADSVEAGKTASLIGFAFVAILMIVGYGTFGFFADIALFVNVLLLFALLSMLQATLTLPGIAGIVLTIGIAVDANVLIYERIREELAANRSPVSAIEAGFDRAMATIIDSNLTTGIAGLILYAIGTGPVKGFAVTLIIGIATSFFTAIAVTRLIIYFWLRGKRPTTLPI